MWTLRDAIYDVPNARILTSQILNPCRDAVGPAAPPRGMLVPRSVLVRLVCATGLRYEPREQGTSAETRERHDKATHDRKLQTAYHAGAQACVLLPRPRPADFAGRCGIPKTRDNESVSQK